VGAAGNGVAVHDASPSASRLGSSPPTVPSHRSSRGHLASRGREVVSSCRRSSTSSCDRLDVGGEEDNSEPGVAVIEHAPIPHWGWGQTPPFEPHTWDDPEAAERGRRRYAEEQAAKAQAK